MGYTVAELLDEYVQLYGLKHWGDSLLISGPALY